MWYIFHVRLKNDINNQMKYEDKDYTQMGHHFFKIGIHSMRGATIHGVTRKRNTK